MLCLSHDSIQCDIPFCIIHVVQKCTAAAICQACRSNDTITLLVIVMIWLEAFGDDSTCLTNRCPVGPFLDYKTCNNCLALAAAESPTATCFSGCLACRNWN